MKSKSTIKIVETPIIDHYDFQENNGVINPAFLDVQTADEDDKNSGHPLVENDYRGNYFKSASPQPHKELNTHSLDRVVNGHNPKQSLASSWVYNNGCSSSTMQMDGPTANTSTLTDMYRAPFGIRYNEHMSYDTDLNRDHKLRSSGKCWPSLVKLFVWSVIIVSLLGIVLSIAFIIYIEKFAVHTCCEDKESLNSTSSRRNGSAIIPVQLLPNSTELPELITTTAQSYTKWTTNVSTTTSMPPVVTSDVTVSVPEVMSTTTTTTSTPTTTTSEPETSPSLPRQPSTEASMTTKATTEGQSMSPETTSEVITERTTATEPTIKSIDMSTIKTSDSELLAEPRILTLNVSQTTVAESETSSVSSKDQIIDNNSSEALTTVTSFANNSKTIITTELSATTGVDDKSTLDEEVIITGTNAPIVTTEEANTQSTNTEGHPISRSDRQETTTDAITTTTGAEEFEYYEEEPSSTTKGPDSAGAGPAADQPAVDEGYIRSMFG